MISNTIAEHYSDFGIKKNGMQSCQGQRPWKTPNWVAALLTFSAQKDAFFIHGRKKLKPESHVQRFKPEQKHAP